MACNITKAVVTEVKKVQSSSAGNPRYSFKIEDGGWVRTSPNLGAAYGLPNDFRIGEPIRQAVEFQINGYGHVYDWKLV